MQRTAAVGLLTVPVAAAAGIRRGLGSTHEIQQTPGAVVVDAACKIGTVLLAELRAAAC